jgi:hypothetical protein
MRSAAADPRHAAGMLALMSVGVSGLDDVRVTDQFTHVAHGAEP